MEEKTKSLLSHDLCHGEVKLEWVMLWHWHK